MGPVVVYSGEGDRGMVEDHEVLNGKEMALMLVNCVFSDERRIIENLFIGRSMSNIGGGEENVQ